MLKMKKSALGQILILLIVCVFFQSGCAIEINATKQDQENSSKDSDYDQEISIGEDFTVASDVKHYADIVAVGGDVTIEGVQYGDVVAVGGKIEVKGQVDGDLVITGGDIHLASTAIVNGDVTTIGGHLLREAGSQVSGEIKNINSKDLSENSDPKGV